MNNRVKVTVFEELTLSNLLNPDGNLTFDIESFIPGIKIIDLQNHLGSDGSISIFEFIALDGFNPKRLFFVHNVPPDESRGFHAHKDCIQLLIAAQGVCTLEIKKGDKNLRIVMDSAEKGVLLPAMTWASQTYKDKNTVLIVLASHSYDPDDYIEDFDLYSQLIQDSTSE
jgi:hypothetical protein